MVDLKRATYYDERKRIANKLDKYADIKIIIKEIGKVAQNLLNQTFDATIPYTVLHTDVSQIRLGSSTWTYMSIILDQALKRF
ncbi:hypothetical protein FC36_GL001937 [Ligilactobacillus equi DSM 15833 = JCM 10991]|uniref:Uncharacterized protein n=2 Tax=Ligilactobacillus equi TaxID=137357 RepID=A0A0R1T4C5_9LACO|nr:hypothetical protein FC36_GL001937 [Ligilactobacillus equi DSM 15833 = JCM 10991]